MLLKEKLAAKKAMAKVKIDQYKEAIVEQGIAPAARKKNAIAYSTTTILGSTIGKCAIVAAIGNGTRGNLASLIGIGVFYAAHETAWEVVNGKPEKEPCTKERLGAALGKGVLEGVFTASAISLVLSGIARYKRSH